MSFRISSKGDFKNTENFFKEMEKQSMYSVLEPYARMGVDALAQATPERSGRTASSWGYRMKIESGHCQISWYNDNVNQNYSIAILIQYGHGTRNGGYVQGTDYINPVMDSVFSEIADQMWNAVQKA